MTLLTLKELLEQNRDYEILISALVTMFGGAVTVSESEMLRAHKNELIAYVQQDPKMFILKVEEPS